MEKEEGNNCRLLGQTGEEDNQGITKEYLGRKKMGDWGRRPSTDLGSVSWAWEKLEA